MNLQKKDKEIAKLKKTNEEQEIDFANVLGLYENLSNEYDELADEYDKLYEYLADLTWCLREENKQLKHEIDEMKLQMLLCNM